jgi:glycerol-1-phosphate dehydrogenase [NAD(P)+]
MTADKDLHIHKSSGIFSRVGETLSALLPEAVRSQPTLNFFSANRHDLERSLVQALGPASQGQILLITDGVSKRSGCGELSADDLILEILSKQRYTVRHISLDVVFGCHPHHVHASVDSVSQLARYLSEFPPSAVLALGSGSLTDVVKHTLFDLKWEKIPFVVVPTALTVTAFTSHFSVLEDAGAKRTRISRRVDTCLWFAPVLSSAPIEMTRAGYGDLLARFVAYGDWYLAWRFGVADRYDELAFHLMEPFTTALKKSACDMRNWPVNPSAIEDLSAILAMAGIAMSVSGETTPLSGYEHTISHALDYLRLTSGRALCWHGEQVALASLSSAESYDQLLSLEILSLADQRPQSEEHVRRTIQRLLLTAPYFGPAEQVLTPEERKKGLEPLQESLQRATEIFTSDYLKKHRKWVDAQSRRQELAENWPEIRAHLRTLVMTADEMRSLLTEAGLPVIPEELSQPTTALEYRWAVRFSPFVRARASLADIIFWLGEDPAQWAIV